MIGSESKNHLASEKRRRNQIRTGFRHLVLLVPALRNHLEEQSEISQELINEQYLQAIFEKSATADNDKDIIGGHQMSKSTILGASSEFIEIVENNIYDNVKKRSILDNEIQQISEDTIAEKNLLFDSMINAIQ
eukprot:NODE_198_length_13236_cov_1.328385.p9 type:complete len:134 gc:universal NODE_198_length_13236_cov_1.328385:5524-5925(+)